MTDIWASWSLTGMLVLVSSEGAMLGEDLAALVADVAISSS